MKLRAVIFDMDGVIADTEPLHARAFSILFKKHGWEFTPEIFRQFIGISTYQNFQDLEKILGITLDIPPLLQEREEYYLESIRKDGLPASPGIPETLRWIRQKGIRTGVGTSSPKIQIETVLGQALGPNYSSFFDGIASGQEVKRPKPAPDIFLLCAERILARPDECLVIEDSLAGLQAAHNAGMRAIAVTSPFTSRTEQEKSAAHVVNTLQEAVDAEFWNWF
jgi:HAD superfamily hydrolase (TIGR01509 family)